MKENKMFNEAKDEAVDLSEFEPARSGIIDKFLGTKSHKRRTLHKSFPGFKAALFFKAVTEILNEYKVYATIGISRGELAAPSYSYLAVGRDKREELLVDGYRLVAKDGNRIVVLVEPGMRSMYLDIYYPEDKSDFALNFLKAVEKYMAENNFYKGEKITPAGEFLPIPNLTFDDVKLPEEKKEAIRVGAIEFFNKKEIYDKNNIPYKRGLILTGLPGCQPKGQMVLMANKLWKPVEKIQIGDKVISPQRDGTTKISKVMSLKKYDSQIYTIKLGKEQDGITYRVAEEHLVVGIGGPLKNYDTIIVKNLMNRNTNGIRIKGVMSPAIEFESKDFVLEPYYLGLLLGDGYFGNEVNITNVDEEVISEIYQLAGNFGTQVRRKGKNCITYSLIKRGGYGPVRNKLIGELKNLNLYRVTGKDKFIPLDYLNSSIDQRLELLAGLIDSDGHKTVRGDSSTYEIITISEKIGHGIVRLCRSLGFGVSLNSKKTSWEYKGIRKYGLAYRLQISPQGYTIPVRIKRKIGELRNSDWKNIRHKCMEIIKENKVEPVYGFTLDSESSWYITDNWILTHNTGKTLTGKILMAQSNCTFIWVTQDMVCYGEDIKYLYDMAKELAPCILFMEDLDDFLERSSAVGIIKTQMDGLTSTDGICTILCTNYPDRLPKPLLDRPSRFDDVVVFSLPDKQLRYEILAQLAEPMNIENKNECLLAIAEKSDELTGAHLKEVLVYALLLSADAGRDIIKPEDLAKALTKVLKTRELVNGKIGLKSMKEIVNMVKKELAEEVVEEARKVKVHVRHITKEIWECPYCHKDIGEKGLYYDSEVEKWYHRPCKSRGSIILPGEDKEETKKTLSNNKEVIKVDNDNIVVCQGCLKEVDYVNEPENAMGSIKCPHCGATIDQTGKVLVENKGKVKDA